MKEPVKELISKIKRNPNCINRGIPSLAASWGVSLDDLKEAKSLYLKSMMETVNEDKSNVEISTDYNLESGEIKGMLVGKEGMTHNDFFYYFNLDSNKFEISRIWAKSHKKGQNTYSVFFKDKKPEIDFKQGFEDFLKNYKAPTYEQKEFKKGSVLGVICLFDMHLGRISDTSYTNDVTSLTIQKDIYLSSLTNLIEQSQKCANIDKYLLVIGNDFFNSEFTLKTTAGTPQDSNTNMYKVFSEGLSILCDAVNLLLEKARVSVIHVPSNHDEHVGQCLATALKKVFEKNKGVSIFDGPQARKYFQYGVNGLMFEHGELKPEMYQQLFTQEGKEVFANTTHHEVLLGHMHSERTKEVGGISINYLSSMCATDRWHYKKGYVMSKRRGYIRFYDEKLGRVGEWIENID